MGPGVSRGWKQVLVKEAGQVLLSGTVSEEGRAICTFIGANVRETSSI